MLKLNMNSYFFASNSLLNQGFIKSISIFQNSHRFHGFNAQQRSNLARKFLQKEIKLKQSLELPLERKIPTTSNPNRKKKATLPITRKLIKLDKIFLEKITDLLSTSEYISDLLENKIEITQAQVQIGYSAVHVHWMTADSTKDEKINNLFRKIAPSLRHELMQLNVFGSVPPILFIKDITHDLMLEIDKRLAVADFGEDFKPTTTSHQYLDVLHKQLKDEVWESLNLKSKEIAEKDVSADELEENIPKLRQNVFGLHRDRIMETVLRGMKSSKGEHRKSSAEIDAEHQSSYVSPLIVKSSSFEQVDGTRTSEIRSWANQFRKKKMKMKKLIVTEEEQVTRYEEEEEIGDSGDMIEDFEDHLSEDDYLSTRDH